MSKFKVGDKVVVNNKVRKILSVSQAPLYKYIYTFDDSGEWFAENELNKTPHERLLDLGFEHSKYTNYNTYKNDYITIDINTLRKGYNAHSAKNEMNYINLELAEILVDYLKELQDE